MDINSIFANAGGTAGIIAVIGIIYKGVNHRRCRSGCCGKKLEMSIDVEETTPPRIDVVEHKNPMIK